MNNDGPLKMVHILLYGELWGLLLSKEHINHQAPPWKGAY